MSDTLADDQSGGKRLAPVISWRSNLLDGSDCAMCKLVGLALSTYMNERGGSAFPSVATLASDCSIAESTVREHLNGHLHKQGWLTLVERGGQKGRRRRANEWQATTPPAPGGVQVTPPADVVTPPANRDDPTGSRCPSSSLPDHDVVPVGLVCRECNELGFASADDVAVHQMNECPALVADDVTLDDAREALRAAGGRG